ASNRLYIPTIKRNVNYVKPFCLYPGSINFSQNFLAIKWFSENVLSNLGIDIDFLITGTADVDKKSKIRTDERLHFLGEVSTDKLSVLYSECICIISPIITGTGIKIKVLEAIEQGIPVVATKKSSNGIFESEHMITSKDDSAEEYLKTLYSFLKNKLHKKNERIL
uniref:glycosyltransferase family 4 protein n=1 Tax=Rosenbergiella metrosideri TaxID=2921185 RepID=UPI001F4F2FBF